LQLFTEHVQLTHPPIEARIVASCSIQ
jgi:hypothetical protein